MKTIKNKNERIWYNKALLKEPAECCFEPEYWQKSGKVIGSATGRGTTWFVKTQVLEAALRHYRRGGLFGRLVDDHYLFLGWKKTRSYQEFELLQELSVSGVNVPRPIAAKAVKKAMSYQADLLSEKVANAKDLVAILQQQSLPTSVYNAIGQQIRKMHDLQVCHTDLNSHNILLDDKETVWLIDFDKCGKQSGDSWKKENLARLKRSFVKEVGKRQIQWQEQDWQALMAGYNNQS
ncbi:3-deoxy-D-manno-octulosonic acid kinase [Vibrio sp. Of7-15]|uniref:3-deoxy-D-manno-octulosonic acid kinase n=1 Tax=Vibrio sp. Of7-15 TaxID=2724879 RepID=UPI001EF1D71C|nr:3-deoxy-D-manno-octulosonic acid kinase [Vibrio sp. Of7-15]MCG7496819.1 3-deoxy-D-manno-octulosonic acid kinase [Vibrio sp. Of7-15]